MKKLRFADVFPLAISVFAAAIVASPSFAFDEPASGAKAFEQLEREWPTANVYRTASGAPGSQYWQQEADYKIDVSLDETTRRIEAEASITYTNKSPDTLRYVWVQLDQNRFRGDSLARLSETAPPADPSVTTPDMLSFAALRKHQSLSETEHGFEILSVKGAKGEDIPYTIVDTMMRVDLPAALKPGAAATFSIGWVHNIVEDAAVGARAGFERFDDDTYLYSLAQWFPRMAAYTDYGGWLHKAFLGRGEFTLEFGDYDVAITVPSDHVVAATGVLQNPEAVLTAEQRSRLAEAAEKDRPMFIVTPEEAAANEREGVDTTKTWRFKAENVRDFAWSSSRKYIWDAMGFKQDDEKNPNVLVMSFYPKEAEPIWSKYSSHAVAHTMDVYSRFSFPYPYPVAQSVNVWERGGMEYPMITFNGYRPAKEKEGEERTYTRAVKYNLIAVIIHEIGHIYFPMIVNSDERQWTWMDEGINTFLQYLAEIEWEENHPDAGFSERTNILDFISTYMMSADQAPIMTQSDSIPQFFPNTYTKPASALVVLRETVLGRELFDFAFREYAERWKFKRPTPFDFFRTMEDASGVDLDWFWRGWFYSIDHVDLSIDDVRPYKVASLDPEKDFPLDRADAERDEPEPLTQSRNRAEGRKTYVSRFPELADFYNENDKFTVSNADRNAYWTKMNAPVDEGGLKAWERTVLEKALENDDFVYFVDFSNKGGIVMPIPLTITYADDSNDEMLLPAEIWRYNANRITRMMITEKEVKSIAIDDAHQIADADRHNNHYPRQLTPSRLQLFKSTSETRDLMRDMMEELRSEKKGEPESGDWSVPLRRPEETSE
ncbi:MAG: M1 family metallopeptidase [Pseudomonadota bacterium]